MLPQGSSAKFSEFMSLNDEQQKQAIADVSGKFLKLLLEMLGCHFK